MRVNSLNNPVNWAIAIIHNWVERKQYGRVILSIENGKIVNVKEERNLKPPREEK